MTSSPPKTLLPGLIPTLALGVAVVACGGAAVTPGTGPEAGRTMVVTSDSEAYCHTLSGVIASHSDLPREVRELKQEGDGMCEHGKIRGGITRLRRALLVLDRPSPQTLP